MLSFPVAPLLLPPMDHQSQLMESALSRSPLLMVTRSNTLSGLPEYNAHILGSDFFFAQDLVIDIPRACLIDPVRHRRFPASSSPVPSISGIHSPTSGPYESILEDFPELLSPNFQGEVKHQVKHYIPTSGPPLHARPRRLDGEKLSVAKQEFKKMEDMGIIRRSDSPWASPLHVVPKADGGW